jgi:predicted amidophosphoribosyltransferase
MVTCTTCGSDVTGKKFCPHCGAAVQPVASIKVCPRCNQEVKPGAAFCMNCGSALNAQAQVTPVQAVAVPATHTCPACHTEVALASAFCTNCGSDMRAAPAPAMAPAFCTHCGQQNAPGMKFCGSCGSALNVAAQPMYPQAGQYAPMALQQPQYQQPVYQQQYGQGGYQPQPMMGQGPMVLRCPTCMAMSPMGTPHCLSCRTSLAGVAPMPSNMPGQPQQGGMGGFLQSGGGQLAVGALGGAAAVIGGEMLLHGIENSIENRVEGNMGYGEQHHREEGLLGGLGELSNDIGLF